MENFVALVKMNNGKIALHGCKSENLETAKIWAKDYFNRVAVVIKDESILTDAQIIEIYENEVNAEFCNDEISELDPRQCVYVSFSDSCTNLVIGGKNVIDRNSDKFELNQECEEMFNKYPNYKTYVWHNLRGTCLVFRNAKNEEMFRWENLIRVR